MNTDQVIRILGLIVSFIQVLIWPLLILFVLLYLSKNIALKKYLAGLFKNASEVTAEAGPMGVKFNVKRVEVATNLALAIENSSKGSQGEEETSLKHQEAVNLANEVVTPQTVQQVAGSKVLWVDDNPSNNFYQRSALEALGIQFTISTSTQDALEKVRKNKYNAIISDMGRQPPDPHADYEQYAGYTLLEALRKDMHISTPFIIYANSDDPKHEALAVERGAFGSTGNPQKLFKLVVDAILKG